MPLYEYECRACKNRFEQLVPNDRAEVTCRACGRPEVSRLLSTFAVVGPSNRAPVEQGPCATCGAAQRGMCTTS